MIELHRQLFAFPQTRKLIVTRKCGLLSGTLCMDKVVTIWLAILASWFWASRDPEIYACVSWDYCQWVFLPSEKMHIGATGKKRMHDGLQQVTKLPKPLQANVIISLCSRQWCLDTLGEHDRAWDSCHASPDNWTNGPFYWLLLRHLPGKNETISIPHLSQNLGQFNQVLEDSPTTNNAVRLGTGHGLHQFKPMLACGLS